MHEALYNVFVPRVRCGDDDLTSTDDDYGLQIRDVLNYTYHEDYRSNLFYYDVAILFLSQPLRLTQYVRPICLVDEEDGVDKLIPHGIALSVVGWGRRSRGGPLPGNLRSVTVSTTSPDLCYVKTEQWAKWDLMVM